MQPVLLVPQLRLPVLRLERDAHIPFYSDVTLCMSISGVDRPKLLHALPRLRGVKLRQPRRLQRLP